VELIRQQSNFAARRGTAAGLFTAAHEVTISTIATVVVSFSLVKIFLDIEAGFARSSETNSHQYYLE